LYKQVEERLTVQRCALAASAGEATSTSGAYEHISTSIGNAVLTISNSLILRTRCIGTSANLLDITSGVNRRSADSTVGGKLTLRSTAARVIGVADRSSSEFTRWDVGVSYVMRRRASNVLEESQQEEEAPDPGSQSSPSSTMPSNDCQLGNRHGGNSLPHCCKLMTVCDPGA
jgi:hypothetical protein